MAPVGQPPATPAAQTNFSRLRSGSNDVPLDKTPTARGDTVLAPPSATKASDARSMASNNYFASRNASIATGTPGSFSSNLKTTNGSRNVNAGGGLRIDFGGGSYVNNGRDETQSAGAYSSEYEASERRQAEFRDAINKEMKIKTGSENLLEALLAKSNAKQTKDQRLKVESELSSSSRKIEKLKGLLHEEIQRSKLNAAMSGRPATPSAQPRPSFMSNREILTAEGGRRSLDDGIEIENEELEAEDEEEESPSFVLAEILQSLESDGMQPDYYISRANAIVDLLQRHPTLKYDLAWSIFGLRVQTMLLSESRDVVAAGYRLTRHAIGDRRSLQIIRELQTDALVILSLAKDQKARIEREQALKFVRAFIDVKDGVKELSNAVVKAVISVAEHHEDALRSTALLTLAEILIREPRLLVAAGGILPLAEALKDGTYPGGESIVASLLFLSDTPDRRKLLFVGQELEGPFGLFSDSVNIVGHEDRLRCGIKSITAILSSWTGLFVLSQSGFQSVTSLLMSLQHPAPVARNLILDLFFDVLRIKPPAWTSSFLAGRRLTTYGRVRVAQPTVETRNDAYQDDAIERLSLIDHYTTLLLHIFIHCGLIPSLTMLIEEDEDESTRRKATILLAEVQKLADHLLPPSNSRPLQPLSSVMKLSVDFTAPGNIFDLQNMVYQLDSVSKTMVRTAPRVRPRGNSASSQPSQIAMTQQDKSETRFPVNMSEVEFREELNRSLVLNHVNYMKWRWDIVHDIIEGPLNNRKSFNVAANDTKWLKRVVGFYRPFKYRFSEARNIRANQRYVRTGSLLIRTLLKIPEGIQYLLENKLFRQLAECLAQVDPSSGITSSTPMFSSERVSESMCGGYFQMIGALTSDQHGLAIISRWRMLNMFYHILDLRAREDLIMALLVGLDFTLDSHLRIILSKALTACEKNIRIFATRLLRKYATQTEETSDGLSKTSSVAYWALRLLITQLYDPSVEVSEVAVGILHEACDSSEYLEFVVRCRPALDHLGEIGAPLLLRFLSSSNGYKYLSGLDYITQEMDDWFLGRNEKYVHLVEASLSRAVSFDEAGKRERSASIGVTDEEAGLITATQAASLVPEDRLGDVPPHFYRELVRTPDGCRLLEDSGHFEAFTRHIRNAAETAERAARRNTVIEGGGGVAGSIAAATEAENTLRVKSCLWAVGNVGSMELGAPFLEASGVVERIIALVRQSPVVSVRGTAFFVLGLISRSSHGMEILAEHGWDAATDAMGRSSGYVLPSKLETLFSLRDEEVKNRNMMLPLAELHEMPSKADSEDEWESKVYAAVVESGNTVLQRRALGELSAIKAKRAVLFKNPTVLVNVMYVFECHSIKLPIRQRVFDMFDRSVMRMIVLEDMESESASEDGSDSGSERQNSAASGDEEDGEEEDEEDTSSAPSDSAEGSSGEDETESPAER